MESNNMKYDYLESVKRIDEVIASSDNSFEELDSIPSRDKLTFTNGFYVYCSALFVDIRKSSELTSKHNTPKLAKLFRTYTSEVIALINGDPNCAEINVVGDCVSGIFNTPSKQDIDSTFGDAFRISSLIDIMNYKFKQNGITEITVGIGLSYGRALMVKAGYNGSGINDVVWMGDVVNEAAKLGGYGNKEYSDKEIMVSQIFYQNLNDQNKGFLAWNSNRNCYHGNVVSEYMNNWYLQNCR